MSEKLKLEEANNEYVVLYAHIPKAGGTTLQDWLFKRLRSSREYKEDKFLCSDVYYYPSGYVQNPPPETEDRIHEVLSRDEIRGVIGHFYFGIHEHLVRPYRYVTMLRNPVDRIVSLYNFQRLLEETRGDHHGVKLPGNMLLEDFVRKPPYLEIDNGQTRRIAGKCGQSAEITADLLDTAKENLERYFAVVGLTERFDESLVLMNQQFGWSDELLYYPKNVTAAGTPRSKLRDDVIALIQEKNHLDVQLYEFATRLFERSINEQGEEFQRELDRFSIAKRAYFDEVGGWDMPSELR